MNSRALQVSTLAVNTAQDNIVATDVPINTTMAQSNLYGSGIFVGTTDPTAPQDTLMTYDSSAGINSTAATMYIYYAGTAGPNGWYNLGTLAGPLDDSTILLTGTGFIVRKIATPTPTTSIWTIPVNYTPQFAGTSLFANGLAYPFVFCTDDNSANTHTDAYVDASGDCLRLTGVTGSVMYTLTNASGTVVASGTYSSSSGTFTPQTGTVGSASDVQAPPAIWIGQSTPVLLEFQSSVSTAGTTTVTYASSDGSYTATLSGASGTSTLSFTLLDSGSNTVASGTYYGSTSIFSISGGTLDVRPINGDGSFFAPVSSPAFGGPPAFWINGVLWRFQGSLPGISDIYEGPQANQLMTNVSNTLTLVDTTDGITSATGTYNGATSTLTYSGSGGSGTLVLIAVDGSTYSNTPITGPPAVWINGSIWPFLIATDGCDYYQGSGAGQWLSIANTQNTSGAGAVNYTNQETGLTTSGVFSTGVFQVALLDVRPRNVNGSFYTPASQPLYGPASLAVEGILYVYQGTFTGSPSQDEYVGPDPQQIVWIGPGGTVSGVDPVHQQPLSGTYAGGNFTGNPNLQPVQLANGINGPNYGPSSTIYVNGAPWQWLGSSLGNDFYAGPQGAGSGQVLSIGQNGAVQYFDPYNSAAGNGMSGTYANGTFAMAGSGVSVIGGPEPQTQLQSGSISGNLDILGNLLAVGSWTNDVNTAGLTINYQDNPTASPPSAEVSFGSTRSSSTWTWSQASPGSMTPATQMMLDAKNRLLLYNPSTGQPYIILDPTGATTSLHAPAQGDIGMGPFTYRPATQAP